MTRWLPSWYVQINFSQTRSLVNTAVSATPYLPLSRQWKCSRTKGNQKVVARLYIYDSLVFIEWSGGILVLDSLQFEVFVYSGQMVSLLDIFENPTIAVFVMTVLHTMGTSSCPFNFRHVYHFLGMFSLFWFYYTKGEKVRVFNVMRIFGVSSFVKRQNNT